MWQRTQVQHSRTGVLDLYARDSGDGGDSVEIAIAFAARGKGIVCPLADRLNGRLGDITIDQNNGLVLWDPASLPAACLRPRLDLRPTHGKGSDHSLDYLKYHLANAVNDAFADRGFFRFLKAELIGTWTDGRCQVSFDPNGTFELSGAPAATLKGAPAAGQWTVGRNMLYLMDPTGTRGVRTQVVDLRSNRLYLPGENGALYTVFRQA